MNLDMGRRPLPRSILAAVLAAVILASAGACLQRGQRYADFNTPTPIGRSEYLVLGFLGGRERWNNEKKTVRQLALKLRSMDRPRLHVKTLENTKRHLAVQLMRNALDGDQDEVLTESERARAKIILYGLSFGGAAVVKLARQLQAMEVPVLLTIQVDSVGLDDAVIPSNVRKAANLYQKNGWLIEGEAPIRAEDETRTEILGNFLYDYRYKTVDISHVHWFKKLFRVAHAKISHDPDVWAKVEAMILAELRQPT